MLLPVSHGTGYLWQRYYHLYSLWKAKSKRDFPDHLLLHGFLWCSLHGFLCMLHGFAVQIPFCTSAVLMDSYDGRINAQVFIICIWIQSTCRFHLLFWRRFLMIPFFWRMHPVTNEMRANFLHIKKRLIIFAEMESAILSFVTTETSWFKFQWLVIEKKTILHFQTKQGSFGQPLKNMTVFWENSFSIC